MEEVLAAYDTLAQQRDAAVRERDVGEREAVDGREVLAHHKRELDAALHQIKIAKVCNDSQAELIERLTLEKMQRFDELNTLRARLAACERVGETAAVRFGILRDRMAACDAETGDDVHELSMTEIPWWIDDLRAVLTTPPLDDDDGPNDGHARTVRRTPPQDAATTRGEG
jgi:hypothetical protein